MISLTAGSAGAVTAPHSDLLIATGVAAAPAADKASRSHVLKVRVKANSPAKLVIKGPKNYKKKVAVDRKTKIRSLTPGTYRIKAKAIRDATGTYRPDRKSQKARLSKKRQVKVTFRYNDPDASTVVPAPDPIAPRTPPGSAPAPKTPDPKATPSAAEAEVLRLTNKARASAQYCGDAYFPPAPALQYDARLRQAARLHSQAMSAEGFFSHVNPNLDQQLFGNRIENAGYDYSRAAENIAAGQSTPQEVVTGWLASPGHCRNMMDPNLIHLGVGYAGGGEWSHYWTQNFATPQR